MHNYEKEREPAPNAKERLVDRATAVLNHLPSPGFRVDRFQRANGIVAESMRNHQHRKGGGSNVETLEIQFESRHRSARRDTHLPAGRSRSYPGH